MRASRYPAHSGRRPHPLASAAPPTLSPISWVPASVLASAGCCLSFGCIFSFCLFDPSSLCRFSWYFYTNRFSLKFPFPARPTSGRNHGQQLRLVQLDVADVKTQKYCRDLGDEEREIACTSAVPEGRNGPMRCTQTKNVGRRRQFVGARKARCLIPGFENSISFKLLPLDLAVQPHHDS